TAYEIETGLEFRRVLYRSIKKDESPFVRDQAAQSLNFQLLLLIGYVISSVLMILLIGYLFWFALWVTSIVFGIMGGMAANRGEGYRFPFNGKWVEYAPARA